ncbi:MAG: deoxyribodipyrimidine photo-lyase [Acidobacteriota bacterium]|nr:deoxyribodipyrimidine photo-lyase [Acidobacteriota bacterium]
MRRDLRLEDNRGLYEALTSGYRVQIMFVFDRAILDALRHQKDARVCFIHQRLTAIQERLTALGASLWTHYGNPAEAFEKLLEDHDIQGVYCNRDYEPYARERDAAAARQLDALNIPFHDFKDQVALDRDEVLTKNDTAYSVYTPYKRRWLALLKEEDLLPCPSEKHLDGLVRVLQPYPLISLEEMGFKETGTRYPAAAVDETALRTYGETRDLPAMDTTSRLGIHLRFGTVSIRAMIRKARELDPVWLSQLIWREFFMQILYHYPHVVGGPFRKEYAHIPWRNDPEDFERWCNGTTGYPIVDAGMRELNATGYMHNRVRMITASFLCKHLLIDWRWGERYFAEKLLDFELAANNGNWQWAAGTGCDAAPYFRVFNPWTQAQKFDPQMTYIKKWVPELLEPGYPAPMIDHKFARQRALDTYKTGLGVKEKETPQKDLFS